MVGIVFFICNLMTLFIIQVAVLGIEKNRKVRRFGINLPVERMEDERVMAIVETYRRRNRVWFVLSFFTLFLNFVKTPYFSLIFSVFIIWNTLMITGKFGIISSAAKSLRKLKETYGWTDEIRDADEKYWHFGTFYYNPSSKKLWANDPSGFGSTVNAGTRTGKIIMAATALVLIGTLIPAWFMIVADDFVPPKIEVTSEALIVNSAFNKTTIAYDEISEILLIDELTGGSKVSGSSTELYRRGIFYYSPYGRCELSIFNDVTPIIVIMPINPETSNGQSIYPILFNAETESETLKLYNDLLNKLN